MANISISNSVELLTRAVIFVVLICAGTLLFSCSRVCTAGESPAERPPFKIAENAVDLNSATAADLDKIPHIGRKLAERIIAHREEHGPFTRPEQLLLIQGISEKSFREIRHLITTE